MDLKVPVWAKPLQKGLRLGGDVQQPHWDPAGVGGIWNLRHMKKQTIGQPLKNANLDTPNPEPWKGAAGRT